MNETLPEYSGEFASCFACGSSEAHVEYVSQSTPVTLNGVLRWPRSLSAFLKRTCECCGYEWAEDLICRPDPCDRCKGSGIDPEDSYPADGPREHSMGEPPVLEPCRDCMCPPAGSGVPL